MLRVDAIHKGIVLDHIQAGRGLKIFRELKLEETGYPVALLMNVPSTKLGRKDMIKVSGALDLDLAALGLLDPNITVNFIEDGAVKKKVKVGLPERVVNLLRCKNPRCITSTEPSLQSIFTLLHQETKEYRCFYCGERLRI